MGRKIQITAGEKYGMLTVIKEADPVMRPDGYPRRRILCECDCGEMSTPYLDSLRRGSSKSCGCQADRVRGERLANQSTHGLSKHPTYQIWKAMNARCSDKKNSQYHDYGGRGITVCDEWKSSPVEFVKWAESNGYRKGLEIERKDNDSGYSADNCVFVTSSQNKRNTRRSYIWHINGLIYNAAIDAVPVVGLSIGAIVNRCKSDNFPNFWRELRYR